MGKSKTYSIEFWEDENGALKVQYWEPLNGESDVMVWSEYIHLNSAHDHLMNLYSFISIKYSFLLDKHEWADNLTMKDMLWQLRRFASKWLAAKDFNTWDWIEYNDGDRELNMDEVSCAQTCPVIQDIESYINLRKFSHGDGDKHLLEMKERKVESMLKEQGGGQ